MNWTSLLALWCERDNRYRSRRSLTLGEAESVRAYRRKEIALLAIVERPAAIAEMSRWTAPESAR